MRILKTGMPRRIAGFTLIELLIVIGIIAMLMGILLPALGRARQEAMKVSCASNLRQWGTSINMFAGDYNTSVPHAGRTGDPRPHLTDDNRYSNEWSDFMSQYLTDFDINKTQEGEPTVQWCPVGESHHRNWPHISIGYYYLANRSNGGSVTYEDGVRNWVGKQQLDGAYSRAPLMSDEYQVEGGDVYTGGDTLSAHISPTDETTVLGGNYLYEDGSVAWFAAEEMRSGANWAGQRDYMFWIPVQGMIDESEL